MKTNRHFLFVIHALVALAVNLALNQPAKAASYTFISTGSMNEPREFHTATLLPNGQVLVAGGEKITNSTTLATTTLASAELYNPATGTWTMTGPMNIARSLFTATLLPNGKVLVVAGDASLASAELYNPATGTWAMTGPMNTARSYYTATMLPNGKVLVAGGLDVYSITNAELYDPAAGTWALTGQMNYPRYGNTATLLPNGKVLVAGTAEENVYYGYNIPQSAELYDPATGTWALTGAMNVEHQNHTANLLANGQVLIAGGYDLTPALILSDAELYNPATGTWTVTGSLNAARENFTSTLLPSGQVLAAGGYELNVDGLANAELYDSVSGTWTPTSSLNSGRQGHTATLLPDGRVLLAGGEQNPNTIYSNVDVTLNSAELYVPVTGSLEVTLGPSDAVSAGAQWQVDGGALQNSGAVVNNLPVGNHTISFSTVTGWLTPGNQTVTVAFGTTTNVSTTYLPNTGSLQLTLGPPGAVSAGAQWQVDGGPFQNSGAVVNSLLTGNHTVSFNTITGWFTPVNQLVTVGLNATNIFSVTYPPNIGAVQVNIQPICAVENGAAWQVDGGAWQASGAVVTNLAGGNHTVSFTNVVGWLAPGSQTVLVTANTTNTATGDYIEGSTPGVITWINIGGPDQHWSTPANWDLNRAPNTNDIVLIPNTGGSTCIMDVDATVAGLIIGDCDSGGSDGLGINGHTLTVTGVLTIKSNAVFQVDSGILMGTSNTVISGVIGWTSGGLAGVLTLASGSTMNIVSGSDHNLANCIFTNNGTVVWTGGRIRGGGTPGTLIQNNGLWNVQLDNVINNDSGGAGTIFNNAGTFRKSVTTGDTAIYGGVFFNQTGGSCDVQGGRVLLQSGGSFTGGTATNTGTLVLNGGGFLINGTLTSTNVQINGGTLAAGSSVITGGLNWLGGVWNNGGPMTIATNSLLLITSGTDHDLYNCVLTNNGTVAWSAGRIRGGADPSGTQIYNNGLFDVQNDGYSVQDDGGGSEGTTINNYGTFRKSVGTNTSNTPLNNGVVFNQLAGVLDTQNGVLLLAGGGNFTGGFTTTNGTGTTYLNAGGFNLNGTVTSSNVVENAGNLVGTNIIRGALQWQAGNWDGAGPVTVTAGSTLYINNTPDHDLASCIFTNNGTVVWTGGRIRGGGTPGTLIQNNGLWNVQLDNVINNDAGGAGTIFNNAGTFRKSVTTGDTAIYGGVFFNQTGGSCDVQGGRVLLQSGGSFTGGTATNTGTLVLNGGGFLINGTLTSTNVQINGGTLAAGSSVINGGLNWVVGVWNNGGPLTIATNSLLLITSGNDHDLNNCVMTNNGTVAWSAGRIRGGADPYGTQIYNYGLFDVQNDGYSVQDDGGGSEGTTINNYGTFRKSVGTNTSNTPLNNGVVFNQFAGVLDTQNGVLLLAGGGNFTGGFTTTNGTGTTYLNAGGFNLNGTVTSSNVVENAGNLVGTNIIRGALQWQAGNWDGAGPVTLATGSTLFINTASDHDLWNCIFTNNGSVVWSGGRIRGGANPSGTQIYNYGLFDVQNDGYTINNDGGGVGTTINNYGAFRKSVGANTSNTTIYGGVLFNQLSGLLDVQTGSLYLQSSGSFTGGKATNTIGTLILNGGGFFINGTITSSNVQLNGGTLAAGNNVVNGGLNWVVGSWNNAGAMTIAPGSLLLVTSGNDHDLANCSFTNNGTVMWLGGRLRGGGNPGTSMFNNGLFDVQCDSSLNDDSGGAGTTFNNAGTVRKELTSGVTTFTGGTTFNQAGGTLSVQTGEVTLGGTYSLTNGTLNFGLNSPTDNGFLQLGGVTLGGALSATVSGSFAPVVGEQFGVIGSSALNGAFSSVHVPAGIVVSYTNNTVLLTVTGPVPVQLLNPQPVGTNFLFQFPTVSGQSYTVQRNDVLSSTNWVYYTNITGSGTLFQFQTPITVTPAQRFFRVRQP